MAATAEAIRASRAELSSPPRRPVVAGLLLLLFGFVLAASWSSVRAHLQALALLQMVSGEKLSTSLARITTEPVTVTDLTLQTTGGPVRSRLYTPSLHPQTPGIVVFHGVHYLGMDEPRLMAFARAMSACGLTVLTPELPDIKDYRVSEGSVKVIGASTVWFAQHMHQPVSVMGLSFSGGLALVAAADPVFRPSMKMILAVGSQGAMERVAAYYRTSEDTRPDGTQELLPAHEYGPLVMEYEHLEEFVPKRDIVPLRALLKAHLYEDKDAEATAMTALNSTQKVEALQLMDTSSIATRSMLRAAELRHVDEMNGLSPEKHLPGLTVPVFLLHGEADNIIPAAETLWMASELRAATLRAALISPVLSHLDMARSPSMWDEWKLVHFMALVLREAKS
ncbi:alpha/beta hydrolase family protein [Terriglobus saanensis]|uniref:alpha/beta hydrolase family protein n=1 Tax=Terriglobus saanensis TaxID=870903 RepID=UPI0003068F80|nr:alpha/beta hydrolase [Terriglobus saanensis]